MIPHQDRTDSHTARFNPTFLGGALVCSSSSISCSSGNVVPSSSTGTHLILTNTGPSHQLLAHLKISSVWYMAGSHLVSAVVLMGQMLAYMVWWTRCGFGMTSILSAPSWTTRKAVDTSWVEATLVRLHQAGVTGNMVAHDCQFSFAAHFHKSEHAERSRLLGLTLALRRDGCSRHFCSTSWSTALQRPYDALRQLSGSCPSRIFVSRVSSTQTTL